jgi:microcystin-dependent protein
LSTPYVGEVRLFAGNFAPSGWMFCEGQLLPISENETLFNLIGTTYGGDGQETFQLPDLRGRVPVHIGNNWNLGEPRGAETVTLTVQQMPAHTHAQLGSTDSASQHQPANNVFASTTVDIYVSGGPFVALAPNACSPAGGSQPHENRQPFACVNYIISLFGIYPSQS